MNGSKIGAKGIDHVSPTPLSLNSVLFIPGHPFNLISLSQLTCSLNYLGTIDADSFVIQEHGMGRMIGIGHESRGLYYLQSASFVTCIAVESPKLNEQFGHTSL